jgi:hypothetical protein
MTVQSENERNKAVVDEYFRRESTFEGRFYESGHCSWRNIPRL